MSPCSARRARRRALSRLIQPPILPKIPLAPRMIPGIAPAIAPKNSSAFASPMIPNVSGGKMLMLSSSTENGIVDDQGKPRFGIHALRHAAASLFIEQGWNPKKIQTLLGHADISTTQIYTHVLTDELAELLETAHPLAMR
mgnify:CR=1 FL=1